MEIIKTYDQLAMELQMNLSRLLGDAPMAYVNTKTGEIGLTRGEAAIGEDWAPLYTDDDHNDWSDVPKTFADQLRAKAEHIMRR